MGVVRTMDAAELSLARMLDAALERAGASSYVGHGTLSDSEIAAIRQAFWPRLCDAISWEEICAALDAVSNRVLDARVEAWNAKAAP